MMNSGAHLEREVEVVGELEAVGLRAGLHHRLPESSRPSAAISMVRAENGV